MQPDVWAIKLPLVPTLHEIPVVVVKAVLQSAVAQHVYVIPFPLNNVLLGHVDVRRHEYCVIVIKPNEYVDAVF